MNTYISMLRGINVSGQKLIKMDALRKLYENMGFANVTTYLQSGNVIFTGDKLIPHELGQKISQQIKAVFTFDVPVIVLPVDDLKQLINNNPFVNDTDKNKDYLYVSFLLSKLNTFDSKLLEDKIKDGEEFAIARNAVYLYCPHGYGNTKLNNNFWEAKLKTTATTRNWKTVNELYKLAVKR